MKNKQDPNCKTKDQGAHVGIGLALTAHNQQNRLQLHVGCQSAYADYRYYRNEFAYHFGTFKFVYRIQYQQTISFPLLIHCLSNYYL